MENQQVEWYNNKTKMRLALLFPPLFAYGIYKTNTMSPKAKKTLVLIVIALIVAGSIGDFDETGKVKIDPWDKSVYCVEKYIKSNLNDPNSYDSIKWGKVTKNSDGTYEVIHSFEARNGFGGVIRQTKIFTIAPDGETVIGVAG